MGSTTPEEALERLRAGHERFRHAAARDDDLARRLEKARTGQQPFAAVVGCIDSRTSPELVLGQSIGDLFVVRVAGNVIDETVLGSLEFACDVAGSRLIVILGHTRCGAIQGACEGLHLGSLSSVLRRIQPAIEATAGSYASLDDAAARTAFTDAVSEAHVRASIEQIRERSDILRNLEDTGAIAIKGAIYHVASGTVAWL